ncbi:variant erythrocyte surface antigen-1 family protein [Babesia caballi]|uniref:Variant erythrocyte surface antigen-1 family protein n=1 Tax=Babesia caballi TaxID=5871 RepID=A0AAV4LX81_BABCB|nr:variant erythrocyte surface antigen-1 family protein [Babesia caballi]
MFLSWSFTDWPEDLKDVIDWILRVGGKDKESQGDDKESELQKAVEKLEGFTAATTHVGNFSVDGLFNYVAGALQHFIGYSINGNHALTGEGIGSNYGSSGYTSFYSNKAQWKEGWNADSTEANTVANIFLGSMPMVYCFVTYLYWKCQSSTRDGWSTQTLNTNTSGLNSYMLQMGFTTDQLSGIKGSEIVTLMTGDYHSFDGLKSVSKSGNSYPTFLKKLEQKHGETKITNAMQCPLYTLYRAAKAYLKYKFHQPKLEESDNNLEEIRKRLHEFTGASKSAYKLNEEYAKFYPRLV